MVLSSDRAIFESSIVFKRHFRFNDYTEHGGAFLPLTTRRAPLTFLFLYAYTTRKRGEQKTRDIKEERLEGDKEGIKRRRTYVFERVSELVLPEPCFGWILCFKKEEFWVETPLLEAKKRKKTDHSWGSKRTHRCRKERWKERLMRGAFSVFAHENTSSLASHTALSSLLF